MTARTPVGPFHVWAKRHRSLAEVTETERLMATSPDFRDAWKRARLKILLARATAAGCDASGNPPADDQPGERA